MKLMPSAITFCIWFLSGSASAVETLPAITGPYFGQQLPGVVPKLFAPGLVSLEGRYEHGISFSPNLDEIYFAANKKDGPAATYFSKIKKGRWTPIEKANFTQGQRDEEIHPFVSLDGKRIYFTALYEDLSDTRIWYVNRTEKGWSEAIRLESPINNDQVFYPNLSGEGELYYFNLDKKKNYVASSAGDEFLDAKEVDIAFGIHAFISPTNDYLLVNARNREDESRSDSDIYVYFKQADGTWGKPINLEAVNTEFGETAPSVTPDGKYLFFGRYNEEGGLSNFYWVSTEVIDQVRP